MFDPPEWKLKFEGYEVTRTRIAIAAAIDEEIDPLLRFRIWRFHLRLREDKDGLAIGKFHFFQRWLCKRSVALVRMGEGKRNAQRALEILLRYCPAKVLLGIGFCGGLTPKLKVGDLLIAERIVDESSGAVFKPSPELITSVGGASFDKLMTGSCAAACAGLEAPPTHYTGTLITADRVLVTAQEKRALWERHGADEEAAVDMEASAIAEVATKHGIPFFIVKAVTDTADEDLPLDFNLCRNEDGSIHRGKVFWLALRQRRLGALWELRNRCRLASQNLAAFVERLLHQLPE